MKNYHLKYRLNISHSVDSDRSKEHNHIFEIEVYAYPEDDTFVEFSDMEKLVEDVLSKYQKRYLNDMPEFEGDTSVENVGEVLYGSLSKHFEDMRWNFKRMEISETPLRVYVIAKYNYHGGRE